MEEPRTERIGIVEMQAACAVAVERALTRWMIRSAVVTALVCVAAVGVYTLIGWVV